MDELNLQPCKHLKYLDLSYNEFSLLAGTFLDKSSSINFLDLSSNQISLIEHSAFEMLVKVLRHGFIDLSNNRLLCTCHTGTLKTISAIQDGKLSTVNLRDMTCFDRKENDFIYIRDANIQALQDECFPSYLWHVGFGFVTCLALVGVTVLIRCAYKKRYQLKTFCYRLRYEQLASSTYRFTCYVSYARADAPWVQDVLIPRLEERYSFKLCVPDRDFCGAIEVDEILDNIANCRSVIIVLSQQFFRKLPMSI